MSSNGNAYGTHTASGAAREFSVLWRTRSARRYDWSASDVPGARFTTTGEHGYYTERTARSIAERIARESGTESSRVHVDGIHRRELAEVDTEPRADGSVPVCEIRVHTMSEGIAYTDVVTVLRGERCSAFRIPDRDPISFPIPVTAYPAR